MPLLMLQPSIATMTAFHIVNFLWDGHVGTILHGCWPENGQRTIGTNSRKSCLYNKFSCLIYVFFYINDITETWRFDDFMLSLSKDNKINMIRGNVYRKESAKIACVKMDKWQIKSFTFPFPRYISTNHFDFLSKRQLTFILLIFVLKCISKSILIIYFAMFLTD